MNFIITIHLKLFRNIVKYNNSETCSVVKAEFTSENKKGRQSENYVATITERN